MKNKYSISFVLPMFNESANIRNTIKEIKSLAARLAEFRKAQSRKVIEKDAGLDS